MEVRTVDAHADIAVDDVVVRTVPAFNDSEGPCADDNGNVPHPQGRGCGFHLTLPSATGADVTVFWPGDTDVLEGHEMVEVSLFCPPIGGANTMDRKEAAQLATALDPDRVCQTHYNTFHRIETNAEAFAEDLTSSEVAVVLETPQQQIDSK